MSSPLHTAIAVVAVAQSMSSPPFHSHCHRHHRSIDGIPTFTQPLYSPPSYGRCRPRLHTAISFDPPSYNRCRPRRRTFDSNLHRRYASFCRCHLTVVIVPTVVQSSPSSPRTTMPFLFLYFVAVPPNALVLLQSVSQKLLPTCLPLYDCDCHVFHYPPYLATTPPLYR